MVFCIVEAEASVCIEVSSITCTERCLLDRNTDNLGLSGVPSIWQRKGFNFREWKPKLGKVSERVNEPSFWCECGAQFCLPFGSWLWLQPRKIWVLVVILWIRKRKKKKQKKGIRRNEGRKEKKLTLFPTSQWWHTPTFLRFIVTLSSATFTSPRFFFSSVYFYFFY